MNDEQLQALFVGMEPHLDEARGHDRAGSGLGTAVFRKAVVSGQSL